MLGKEDEETVYGNAFMVQNRELKTEQEAQRVTDQRHARTWKFVNPSVLNLSQANLSPTSLCPVVTSFHLPEIIRWVSP